MGNIKPSNIPNRLRNVSAEHPYVAGAVDIYDDAKGENQQSINADTYRKNEVYNTEEIANIISRTPETDVVVLDVPEGSTALDVLDEVPVADRPNKLFRLRNDDNTHYDEYGWTGTEWALLASKDYGIDDEPQLFSDHLVKSNGIAKVCGFRKENPEWVYAITTRDDVLLFGIRADGSVYENNGFHTNIKSPEYAAISLNEEGDIINAVFKNGKHFIGHDLHVHGSLIVDGDFPVATFMQVPTDWFKRSRKSFNPSRKDARLPVLSSSDLYIDSKNRVIG